MKKSLYRKIVLCLLLIILATVIIIAIKIDAFPRITSYISFEYVVAFFENQYVCNLLCGVISIIIVYIVQLKYAKYKLKKDFRCDESIQEIFLGIDYFSSISENIPEPQDKKDDESYTLHRQNNAENSISFYKNNITDIKIINGLFTYRNKELFLDSLKSSLFINLNFTFLGIYSHIKDRLPNLREDYPEIEKLYEEYEKDPSDELTIKLGEKLQHYFVDLKFMVKYYWQLLDYIGFDFEYSKLWKEINKQLLDNMDNPVTVETIRASVRTTQKIVTKEWLKYKFKNFWKK